MLASVAKMPSMCASVSGSMIFCVCPSHRDAVSPPESMADFMNEVLCQRRLLSGFGEGGMIRSERKILSIIYELNASKSGKDYPFC
jgi:hypothetical protein